MNERSVASFHGNGRRFTFGTVQDFENNNSTLINYQTLIKANSFESSRNDHIFTSTCLRSSNFEPFCNELNISNELLPRHGLEIETAQKWLALKGKNDQIHQFPLTTILPKVQMMKHVMKRHLPRDVEVDRRRRMFSDIDIVHELSKTGLDEQELLPTEEQYYILSENAFKHFLPLSFFDDFDEFANADKKYPLPAKAFLPVNQSLLKYKWQNACITNYDPLKDKWSAMVLTDEFVYKVPKIQILFLADNPFEFIERVKQAVTKRQTAETLIMMRSLVDCVLWQQISANRLYANKLVEKLMKNIETDKNFYKQLRLEIYLIFEHLMTCYEFEKFLKLCPDELPCLNAQVLHDSLPQAYRSKKSEEELKFLEYLQLKITERKLLLLKKTLFYTPKGIEAILNVASECQYIEALTLFLSNFSKPLALFDFQNTQQNQCSKTSQYLKTNWPSKIANGIVTALRALGKGWLDTSLVNWQVYKMCKIYPFMLQVKLRMQESIQVLLEKSIKSFTNPLADPCRQFLHLDSNYQWSHDFKTTEFPCNKPIFLLTLSVSMEKEVVYSNRPEEFAPAIGVLFKKCLEMVGDVRQVDGNCLINLRFSTDLFILTVELIEDLYNKCNALLQECYVKAVYPLKSYARNYNRFTEFYLLSEVTFMEEYKAANKSSMQVKADILEHKRCKEEIKEILPAAITIGPFLVIVEYLKQHLLKKHTEIIKKIFEYYVERMYETNEHMLDRCLEIYQKINDRPQSIEHLYTIKDFALTVPILVDNLRADIQIMSLEYDMLDSFFYNIPDQQFVMKWEVYAWPKNILQRLTTLREEQKNDIEDFKRLHLSECIGFEEHLQSLNDEIQQLSLRYNPKQVTEIAVEIKKLWKVITDLQKHGETLQYRQKLFELDELSLEFLNSIIDSFLPYKTLWFACQDLVKLEEATLGNPLVNIELHHVMNTTAVIRNSLNESLRIFKEKSEIQEVALYFLSYLEDFMPKYKAIEDFRNDNWLLLHWQELAARSSLDIKYSMAMNFQYCIRKGIMKHLELVHEISEKATNEADAIRKAFEEEERRKEEEKSALLMRKTLRKCRRDIL